MTDRHKDLRARLTAELEAEPRFSTAEVVDAVLRLITDENSAVGYWHQQAGRDPLEAIGDVNCPHPRHQAMCAHCAADALRPEFARLTARADAAEAKVAALQRDLARLQWAAQTITDNDWYGRLARGEQTERELAEAKAASEQARRRLDELDGGTSIAADLGLLDPPDLTVIRHVISAVRAALDNSETRNDGLVDHG